MSYEIVKNCRVERAGDGSYYAVIKSACNNVHPHYYEEWTYGRGKFLSKEQLEKDLLFDFFYGNLQRGSSKYRLAAKYCPKSFLTRYHKMERIIDKAYHLRRKLATRIKFEQELVKILEGDNSQKELLEKQLTYTLEQYKERIASAEYRLVELETLTDKLYTLKRDEAKEGLYLYFKTMNKEKKIKGVYVTTKNGCYVTRINRNSYSYSLWTQNKKLLTGKQTIARVLNESYWKDNFDIEVVYA